MGRLKYHCGFLVTGFTRVLNLLVIAGGIAGIVMIFVVERQPQSVVGWGFIGVGIFAIIAGATGVCAASRTTCFGCHVLIAIAAAGGLAVSALCIYVRIDDVIKRMRPSTMANVREVLKIEGGIFAGTFVLVAAGIVLSFFVNCCDLVNYNYEDLEMADRRRADLHKIKQDANKGVAKKAPTKAAALADKMREKYGRWTSDGDFAAK